MKCWNWAASFVFIAGWLATISSSVAQQKITTWYHDGSALKLVEEGKNVTISYTGPKRSLRNQGVKVGSVLFTGEIDSSGQLSGEAQVFRAGCLPVKFDVSGKFEPQIGKIILKGQAPVRAKIGCRVVSYTKSGSAAEIVLTTSASSPKVAAAPEKPQDRNPIPPDHPSSREQAAQDRELPLANREDDRDPIRDRDERRPDDFSRDDPRYDQSRPDDQFADRRYGNDDDRFDRGLGAQEDYDRRDRDYGRDDRDSRDYATRDFGGRRYDDRLPPPSPDVPFDGERNIYDHNGSTVQVTESAGGITISYLDPQPRLRDQGVRRGTVLFRGRINHGDRLNGTAYNYRRRCEPEPYAVRGRLTRRMSGRIVLRGDAPIRRRGSCEVIARTQRGPFAFIVLNPREPDESGLRPGQRENRTPSYRPQTGNVSVWDHNGSEVLLEVDGSSRIITFHEPRPGLNRLGIRRGTPLFKGEKRGEYLTGRAYAFQAGCPPVEYDVEGEIDLSSDQSRLILRGKVPILSPGDCHVVGYSWSNPNSALVFNFKYRR